MMHSSLRNTQLCSYSSDCIGMVKVSMPVLSSLKLASAMSSTVKSTLGGEGEEGGGGGEEGAGC